MNKLYSNNTQNKTIGQVKIELTKTLSKINFIRIQNKGITRVNIGLLKTRNINILMNRNFADINRKENELKVQEEIFKGNKQNFPKDKENLKKEINVKEPISPIEQMNSNHKNKQEEQKIFEDANPEEALKRFIKESENKKLSDYVSEELRESAQEKYKEINFNYFKQKEVFTRAQILGIKSNLEKAAETDPEWAFNMHRKFLQRNFLKKNNIFYDFEKEELDEKKINYEFLKSLKLDEPIILYECFLPNLKPMISAKRHAFCYGLLIPYIYLSFFFNYDFLFSNNYPAYFPHLLVNSVFIGFIYNYKLMRYYNKTLVLQIKYNGKEDTVLFYTSKGLKKGTLEVKHKVSDLYGFKKDSIMNDDYVYVKSKTDSKILYLIPSDGIYHEREAFQNIFGLSNDARFENNSKIQEKKENVIDEKNIEDFRQN